MRVISGSAKGYGLKAPSRMKLRPTPARVKEAVFSSLAERVPGARVLDLFAGTGAFAIEMLSRGADSATLVEKDGRATALIEDNLRKTRLLDRARLLRADARQALEWLRRDGARFDVIFADPPYFKGELPAPTDTEKTESRRHGLNLRVGASPRPSSFSWQAFLLRSEALAELLAPRGILLIEHFKKETGAESPYFDRLRQFRFGDTVVSVFAKRAASPQPCKNLIRVHVHEKMEESQPAGTG